MVTPTIAEIVRLFGEGRGQKCLFDHLDHLDHLNSLNNSNHYDSSDQVPSFSRFSSPSRKTCLLHKREKKSVKKRTREICVFCRTVRAPLSSKTSKEFEYHSKYGPTSIFTHMFAHTQQHTFVCGIIVINAINIF